MKVIKNILVIISIFTIILMFTGTVSAAEWTVNPGDNIQSTINNASDNDTITVNDNNGTAYTYTENIIINKKLQLYAKNGSNVTVQALNPSKPVFTINSSGSGSTIKGFNITGATRSYGIYVNNANNCNITGNTIYNNINGIYARGSATIISENTVTGSTGDGIVVIGSNMQILNNYAFNNTKAGIVVNGPYNSGTNATVTGNTVTGNGAGIYIYNTNNITIIGNTATNNRGTGIYASGNTIIVTSDNAIHDNTGDGLAVIGSNINITGLNVYNNTKTGIVVNGPYNSGTNATVTGNTVTGNAAGISIYNTNYATISVNTATGNRGTGIYTSGNYATLIGNTVTSNSNNGIHVAGDNAVITGDNVIHDNGKTGLYVRGNNINLTGFNIYNNSGCGIDIAGLNLTVINNTIDNNGNAGIIVNSAGVIVSGNTVTNNGNRGFNGWSWNGIDATGTNAIVSGNTVTGDGKNGINVTGDNVQILQNSLLQNKGYGINAAGLYLIIAGNNVTNNGNAGIIINGANATLTGNNATDNGKNGFNGWNRDEIHITGNNAIVTGNTVTNNGGNGIYVTGTGVFVSENTATNNQYGIYFYNSSGTAKNNNITGNQYGIYLSNSSFNINFNRIIGNSKYGLYNTGNGIINATNNWWGSNNCPSVSPSNGADINLDSGTVTYGPWLVLKLTASPAITDNNSTITADLTHNNAGEDTSSQGHIPDNVPITFITNLGTINSPVYTRNGKASATFNRGASTSGTANITATLDNQIVSTNVIFDTPLVIIINPVGGWYNTNQTVTLATIDPNGTSTTYYTTDGSDPRVNGIVYSNPITINTTTTLRYIAVDPTNNWGPEYTQNYTIDTILPTATANLPSGVYNTTQTVNLTATDNLDPNPAIYYTTDGSNPTTSSTRYTGPINLQMNLITRTIINLKFIAVDQTGNMGLIQNEIYSLTLPVVDITTNKTYSHIQDAINDVSTLNGDIIQLYSGIYTETITVNKKLTIMPVSGNNVTIMALNPNGNVFTITSGGNGSIILGLILNGNINLSANNCTIYNNTIIGNGTSGIIASNSFNSTISYNNIISNGFNGIETHSSSNTIFGNTIHDCENGIYSENSNNKISSNNIINNHYGIFTYNSTDTIQFNRISGNIYGLRNDLGTLNATNNWWGTNSPSNPNDIWIVTGNVTYAPWLVLNVDTPSTNSGGNTEVTADLTHNSQGGDTSPQGHIPDGIPVNFTTSFGTIVNSSYTVKGKSKTILNLGNTQPQEVTVTASLDNQTISTTGVITTGSAVLNITSTAIDNSTNTPLNTTYTIPLNESVTWLSVLWTNTGMFTDELKIIVNGAVVQDKHFYNTAYTTWKNSYSSSVFDAILYANWNFQFVDSSALTLFWNNLQTKYNLTSTELIFIQNHRQEFIDNLTVNIAYSGVPGLNMTVTDPKDNNTINLNFPGNVINRTSQIVYQGANYEGLKSFAIATAKVNNSDLQYWVNQSSLYPSGSMNAAYGNFLGALLVEYLHDQVADNAATKYNVTWSRTSPIIVSMCDEPYQTYLTLECDHSMGMTVIGTPENMWMFKYVSSSAISPIEYAIMNTASNNPYQSCSSNGVFSSVTMDLLKEYSLNSTSINAFMQNGYLIEKSIYNNYNFMVIDLETGLVRDINTINNFCGAYYGTNYVFIKGGIAQRSVTNKGEIISLGTHDFWWDGFGRVLIASSPAANPLTDRIWVDDKGIAWTGFGAISFGEPTPLGQPVNEVLDVDITSILQYGDNQITINIMDVNAGAIGCSSLSIIQVVSGNIAYNSLQLENMYQLGENFTNNAENFKNWFTGYFKDFPAPIPTGVEAEGSFRGIFKNTFYMFLLGYYLDINIWLIKKGMDATPTHGLMIFFNPTHYPFNETNT